MPATRIPMRQFIEIMRLKYEAKLSNQKVALAAGVSKGAVSKYLHLAAARGVTWPLPEGTDEAQLERLLFPATEKPSRFAKPDYFQVHQELKRKGVTKQLLWQEYRQVHPDDGYSYAQFCHRYLAWLGCQKRSMRQIHRAGEKLFVDYCGPTMSVVNPDTGEARQAQVFVAVLGASNYTFAEATLSQTLPDWLGSHVRAFEYFGGTTAIVVPDNLKSGVTKACRYDPQLNASYQQLAEHYQLAVVPARPYKPRDKAKAEVGVQIVERWILARLRHHSFFSLAELNQGIRTLLDELNTRPFKQLPGNRREAFEQL